jgi:hypothetical protein
MKRAGNWFEVIEDDLPSIQEGANPPPIWMHVGRSGEETCHPYGIRDESAALHDTGDWAR